MMFTDYHIIIQYNFNRYSPLSARLIVEKLITLSFRNLPCPAKTITYQHNSLVRAQTTLQTRFDLIQIISDKSSYYSSFLLKNWVKSEFVCTLNFHSHTLTEIGENTGFSINEADSLSTGR
ncbi:hypothetical protein SAMN05216419_103220 [Nitrosomonas cryotolerans]|uniref:Uncharacterized protein n=1 Tax=Nitrosomonas cryotolerans ATCC 49181 TaxID=1131553 RepID=A0A1N6I609_9PROT|nr:hypothetical protein SAMN05216419_103220 [Nitrosomonas cryotolerans]SIO27472.1 hypothetical protein SAMN02743940_1566 [Nitrosomonas cryotolerans ATCC 49181]